MALTGLQAEIRDLFRGSQSSLGGGDVHISGLQLTIENMDKLKRGIAAECTMQSKLAAQEVARISLTYCPENQGHLKRSVSVKEMDIMSWPGQETEVTPSGSDFTFSGKQRNVWWVSYGNDDVEYAAAIHENPTGRYEISKAINPLAKDHWLYDTYVQYKPYFSTRIMDRFQAQVLIAEVRAAAQKAAAQAEARAFAGLGSGRLRLRKPGMA